MLSKNLSWNSVNSIIASLEYSFPSSTITNLSSLSLVLWITAIHFPLNVSIGSNTPNT